MREVCVARGETMDLSRTFMHLIGHLVEGAADWHTGLEARAGDQVVAIALRSGEGFVQCRGRLYLFPASEVRGLLPGRRLSVVERRGLFAADGQGHAGQRLERGAFVSAELRQDGTTGLPRLVVTRADGGSRAWTFSSLTSAEDLLARLESTGVMDAGGE
jgi:hypothetical protein